MTVWDKSVDVISIGSGGGGMMAALAASASGGTALVVEKRDVFGGSTAMSGGVIWIPNNPLMQRDGIDDSDELGMQYFASTVGDAGPASSTSRRRAFIVEGNAMTRFLLEQGVRLIRCAGYSDYYASNPGGSSSGRSMESPVVDGRTLGPWLGKLQPGMATGIGLVMRTNELRDVQYFNRSVRSFVIAARVQVRTWAARLLRRPLLTNGAALMAQLLSLAVKNGVELQESSAFTDFIVEDGRVVGVRLLHDGKPQLVQARRAVVVAAGGFAHNENLRVSFGGTQAVTGEWSDANPGDTGDTLGAMTELGARTDFLDEAWWYPSAAPGLASSTLSAARSRPGTILVDAEGRRFVNESNSYVEVGKAMFARNVSTKAVPAWLVFDDEYRRRYAHRRDLVWGKLRPEWVNTGLIKRGDTLEELAAQCGIDPAGLVGQVASWNETAVRGEDPEFGRGTSAYHSCMGDPGHRPNRSVGPLAQAPFYAFEVFPRDVGTCGGVVTDEFGRVLRDDGSSIPGLYATGNSTATVTGRRYLGAGSSIANSMIFGYVSARHAMSAP